MHRPKDTADNGHKSVVREQTAATVKISKRVREATYKEPAGKGESPYTKTSRGDGDKTKTGFIRSLKAD